MSESVRSDRTLAIESLSLQRVSARLQTLTGTSEQLPTGHLIVIRWRHARHFSSIQQSPLCRRTVHCLRRLVAKIQGSIPTQIMRDLWWTEWYLDMPVAMSLHQWSFHIYSRIISAILSFESVVKRRLQTTEIRFSF